MKPKKKNDKPKNKWKIAAIISMAINLLVAVLLAVGLAQPKTAKTNALSGGDYYIYQNSYNINPTDFDYGLSLHSLNWSYVSEYDEGTTYSCAYSFPSNSYAYLDTGMYVSYFYAQFKVVNTGMDRGIPLYNVMFYPFGSEGSYYSVFECYYEGYTPQNITYRQLGYTSDYLFIPKNTDSGILDLLDSLFINLGDNSITTDYLITDNFNPNKYISIASDSIGALYDPPSAYSNYTSGVKWSNPIYRGSINGAKYSTLGFLEIPLLFSSGGENFVGIRYYYDVVQSYIDKNNEWQTIDYGSNLSLHEFHYTFVYMSYVYELANAIGTANTTWKEKVVCAVPVYRIYHAYVDQNVEYRDYGYYLFQSYKWLSDSYKTISVYEASTEQLGRVGIDEDLSRSRFAINGLTIEEILKYDMTQEKDGVGTGNYIGNVFIVIKDAFASLMPLLSLTIIPGITIGMLLFLPLVLTIIIVVIKLVKR